MSPGYITPIHQMDEDQQIVANYQTPQHQMQSSSGNMGANFYGMPSLIGSKLHHTYAPSYAPPPQSSMQPQTPQSLMSPMVPMQDSSKLDSNIAPIPSKGPMTPMTPMTPADPAILPQLQNIVSTVNLNCKLDLKKIALQARNAEYNPKRFAAVIMRIREPRTTALIFSSGKMVCI